MSLRNKCNQLNKVLYQLMMLFTLYKETDKYNEASNLAERLKSIPYLTEKNLN